MFATEQKYQQKLKQTCAKLCKMLGIFADKLK